MGTEGAWFPILVSALTTAGAAGMQVYNTNKDAKRQDRQLAAQLRAQGDKQREADARTAELVQERAKSDDTDERASSLDSFVQQMRANKGNATGGLDVRGAVSDAYRESAQDAALGAQSYGNRVADLMSRIDAPTQQRQNELAENIRFGDDIGGIVRRSTGDDFLHQMRLRGIQRNPWIDLGAGLLQGAGNAYAAGAGATANAGAQSGYGPMAGGYQYPSAVGKLPTRTTGYGLNLPYFGG